MLSHATIKTALLLQPYPPPPAQHLEHLHPHLWQPCCQQIKFIAHIDLLPTLNWSLTHMAGAFVNLASRHHQSAAETVAKHHRR
jgi:hypothetical protein